MPSPYIMCEPQFRVEIMNLWVIYSKLLNSVVDTYYINNSLHKMSTSIECMIEHPLDKPFSNTCGVVKT